MNEIQKNEAIKRMKKLGLMKETIDDFDKDGIVNVSEHNGILFWADDSLIEKIKQFEKETDSLVYHVINCCYQMSDGQKIKMTDFLYVSKYDDEWDMDNIDIENGEVMSYCISEFGNEFGFIGIKEVNGGLARVY